MPSKKDVPRICKHCGDSFLIRRSDAKRGLGKFCSRSCKSKYDAPKVLKIGATGPENPNWRGGQTRFTNGYWYVLLPEHPRALKSGYVKRADLSLEKKLGRPLHDGEIAHHKDEDRENDSEANLELKTIAQHNRLHHGKPQKPKNPHHPVNRRYDWPVDTELLEMRRRMTLREIAGEIGCNHKTVDRRIKRILER